jgi:hypothetical protein
MPATPCTKTVEIYRRSGDQVKLEKTPHQEGREEHEVWYYKFFSSVCGGNKLFNP